MNRGLRITLPFILLSLNDLLRLILLQGLMYNPVYLNIHHGLVGELSHCLRLDDGEHPLELLPELQELTYPGSGIVSDAFTSFIDACQNTGHSVTLIKS
jgi:hypothetical protein